jgi:hypothetical protein
MGMRTGGPFGGVGSGGKRTGVAAVAGVVVGGGRMMGKGMIGGGGWYL